MKLNLGCGNRERIPGFTNVDLVHEKNVDIVSNVGKLPMIASESVELIYASHVLEYFDRDEARDVLTEWKRLLMPKGVLRLAVPDFEALVVVYERGYELSDIIGPLYGKMSIGHGKNIYHKTVYDYKSLRRVLQAAGFINVHMYKWQNTVHKDYDDWSQSYLPHMNKENGILISLNVESVKP